MENADSELFPGDSITEQSKAQLDILSKRMAQTEDASGYPAPKAQVGEVEELKADLAVARASLAAAREDLVEMGKSWQSKMEQLVNFAKQSKANDTNMEAEVERLKGVVNKQELEMARREDVYQEKINYLELNQQKQLMDLIDDLATIGAKPKK